MELTEQVLKILTWIKKPRVLLSVFLIILGFISYIYMNYIWVISRDRAIIRTIQVGIVVLFLFLLVFAFYGIAIKNKALQDEKTKLVFINENLKEKEELFRTIFEQSPVGITFGSLENDIVVDNNVMFEKIIGRSKEELAVTGWSSITHPDDLQKDLEDLERFKLGEIKGYSMVKRYFAPDNSVIWTNIKIAPLKIKSIPSVSYMCTIEDITERVQAEESLREMERSNSILLSNLPGMAYRCNYDKRWTMQFVSEGSYDLTGYKPEELIQNKRISFYELINPEHRELLWDKWTNILKLKSVLRDEYSITTLSGEVKWVFEQSRGIYDDKDNVTGIEGLIIDITDRKKREDEIHYLNCHDTLTGLYNWKSFEEEKSRIDNESQLPLSVIIGDINGLKLINNALGHSEGDKLITAMSKILSSCCCKSDILARTGGDEFTMLLPKTTNEDAYRIINLIEAACEEYKRTTVDETYHTSISLGCGTKTTINESLNSVIKIAEDNMYRHKLLQNKSFHSSIIASMKTTMFAKSQETEEHAQRLIEISKKIGRKMNLVEEKLNELELLSTLHDIGKIGISDTILNNPGKLNGTEWAEMRKHPEIGYRIAMSSKELAPIADCILCHHERWDGKGYPQGLKGKDIPLLARIISIADAYDAMTENRSYRKAMTKEAAISEITANSAKQFDSEIVKVFLEIIQGTVHNHSS